MISKKMGFIIYFDQVKIMFHHNITLSEITYVSSKAEENLKKSRKQNNYLSQAD